MSANHRARGYVDGSVGWGDHVVKLAEGLGVRLVASYVRTTSPLGFVSERVRFVAEADDGERLVDFLHVIGAR